jgi:Protein of unknown function (DUF3386)
MTVSTTQLDARELFKGAYENRYTWDETFPGYTADFVLNLKDQTYIGKVKVTKGMEVTVETNDEKAEEWLRNQMKDVVVHRKFSDFESSHGKHTFTADGEPDTTGAVAILVGGDAMGSNYKVRDQQVVQVSRVMGRMAFTINHLDKIDTGLYQSPRWSGPPSTQVHRHLRELRRSLSDDPTDCQWYGNGPENLYRNHLQQYSTGRLV